MGWKQITLLGVSDQEIHTLRYLDYRKLAAFSQRTFLKIQLIII